MEDTLYRYGVDAIFTGEGWCNFIPCVMDACKALCHSLGNVILERVVDEQLLPIIAVHGLLHVLIRVLGCAQAMCTATSVRCQCTGVSQTPAGQRT